MVNPLNVTDSKITQRLLGLGWKLPYNVRLSSSSKPVILVYHGIPKKPYDECIGASEFERQILFIKEHFEIIDVHELWETRKPCHQTSVMLTFDDGFRNNAEVVAPILRRLEVPALFFVSSRHATPGKYLWFSYLNALEKHFRGNGFYFRGQFINMSRDRRQMSLTRLREFLLDLRPHPGAMYLAIEEELPRLEDFVNRADLKDCYWGMTAEQVRDLATDRLFTIGVHTVDHPFLTRCDPGEVCRQILENKSWIEEASGKPCDAIAYPGGDYCLETLKRCSEFAFTRGYAVMPLVGYMPQLEFPRIGVYSASLDILGFKVEWGNFMRRCRLTVG